MKQQEYGVKLWEKNGLLGKTGRKTSLGIQAAKSLYISYLKAIMAMVYLMTTGLALWFKKKNGA